MRAAKLFNIDSLCKNFPQLEHLFISDRNTFIVGMNSETSMCQEKKDDNGPVTIDKSVHSKDRNIGKIIAYSLILSIF